MESDAVFDVAHASIWHRGFVNEKTGPLYGHLLALYVQMGWVAGLLSSALKADTVAVV